MGFRFCLGPSGSGKSRFLHRYLLQNARTDLDSPAGMHTNYVMLVPEQYSMITQKELVTESPDKGIMNIDVQSFGRLAYRVFQETGVVERAVLGDIGKMLLLRRAAGLCADELQVLGKAIHRPGMLAEVKSVLSEFMQYGIDSASLLQMSAAAGSAGQGALSARLRDLHILYDAFLDLERDRFVTTEERLTLLAQAIPRSAYLRGSVVVLDGFTGFTPVQYSVITALIGTAREVIISLPMNEDGGQSVQLTKENASPGREDALFYLSRKTISDLMRLTKKMGYHNDRQYKDIIIGDRDQIPHRFASSPVLAHLEKNIFRHPLSVYEKETGDQLRIIEADTVEEEIRQICIQIRRLTLEKGYEYRQISVICGDLNTYGELFEKIAARYDIPLYVDRTGNSALNPLTEAIRAALQMKPGKYSYQSVFRYLRSGMSGLSTDETDRLENYCLEHGIRGRKKWDSPFDADTEPLRIRFLQEISPLTDCGKTAASRTRALYKFMTACSMEEKMLAYAEALGRRGDAVRKKQFEQLYRRVIELLDQMVDLLGDEEISDRDFAEILDAGFAEIRLGTLPQQVDRVLVGDIERTRVPQSRILILTGVNDGNIPVRSSKGGILSELDREFLRKSGAELAPTPREQMYLQRLYLYLNMTKPTDTLMLSAARIARDGSSLQPSYLISMLSSMFPMLRIEHPQLESPVQQITGRKDAMPWLSDALREYAQGSYDTEPDKADELRTVYGYLHRTADADQMTELDRAADAAFMRYDPMTISPGTAKKLYGSYLRGSITKLETMALCPMRQFLTYGLGLRQRQEFRIEPADTGNILHESMDRFERKMKDNEVTWISVTDEEAEQMIREALEETAASYHDLILYSSARSRYRKERLAGTLQTAVDAIRYQLSKGDFIPAFHEFIFGQSSEAGPLEFSLGAGRKLSLSGRVDRVDLMFHPGKVYVKILDYKLGARELKAEEMKRGLQLQLMIYMQAVMEYEKKKNPDMEVIPAAMFYLHMNEPLLTIKDAASSDGFHPEQPASEEDILYAKQKINEAMRPTGLVNAEEDVIRHMDRTINGRSDVIPVKIGSRGTPDSRSSHIYTKQEFENLCTEIRSKVTELASDILNGKTDVCPIRIDRNTTACTWCPFSDVCVFDPRISGFTYRDQ